MTPTPAPTMPYALNAAKAQGMPADLMPPMPTVGSAPPAAPLPMAGAPPPAAPAMMPPGTMPPATPAGPAPFNPPGAPSAPPYSLKTQPDGTIAVVWPSPDGDPGKDIISQVLPAPSIPKALQPAKA